MLAQLIFKRLRYNVGMVDNLLDNIYRYEVGSVLLLNTLKVHFSKVENKKGKILCVKAGTRLLYTYMYNYTIVLV